MDAFFVIMKAIFTPDIGDQKNVKIAKFNLPGGKGFITYNFDPSRNYFDCDVVFADDSFCKVYIKDKGKVLQMKDVAAIISTLKVSDAAASDETG
jgi:hypothetical protein